MAQQRNGKHSENRADLIWSIANKLVGLYKPHEYGKVILPFTVIKRFSDTLNPTRQAVLDAADKYKHLEVKDAFLRKAAGLNFYNTCKFSFEQLLSDPDNIEANLRTYINSFSQNVIDIIFGKDNDNEGFNFDDQIRKLANANTLFIVVQEFCSQKAYLGADAISSAEMGYIFEHLIKKFSESYNEEAGAHFTARDIVYLMTDLLIAGDTEDLKQTDVIAKTVYDMAMGTSQMLGCLTERIHELNPQAEVTCYGQEFNPETFAIAKSDMLIRGGDANNMKYGNTLSDDQFLGYNFDYIISNPPFGIDWKKEEKKVRAEHDRGEGGRFSPGLPGVGDGQMLFLLNGVAKLKDNGRMTIIQNGSPLQGGDAGGGQSEIRRHIIENDWLEAIVQMPNDLFYNTGITTYIWIISKDKHQSRKGKVQLINAKEMYEKRRKALGDKRVDFTDECIANIVKVYKEFKTADYTFGGKVIESKVFDNDDFKYFKVTVETPLVDESGKPILDKKGKLQSDKTKRDTESIPAKVSFDDYMAKNVLPYNPLAYIDESKTKVGYEIPFTRLFYKYQPPRNIDEIYSSIKEIERQERLLMEALFADDHNHSALTRGLNKDAELVESEIDWIGEMPKHWEILDARRLFSIRKSMGNETEILLAATQKFGMFPQDEIDGVVQVKADTDLQTFKTVHRNDFVISLRSFQGGFEISDYEGVCSPAYQVFFATKKISHKYFKYLFKSERFVSKINSLTVGIREGKNILFSDFIKHVKLPYPPVDEQEKIAELYEKLEELILLKQRAIAELQGVKIR